MSQSGRLIVVAIGSALVTAVIMFIVFTPRPASAAPVQRRAVCIAWGSDQESAMNQHVAAGRTQMMVVGSKICGW